VRVDQRAFHFISNIDLCAERAFAAILMAGDESAQTKVTYARKGLSLIPGDCG
jgi:hypothetical protein